MMLRVEDKVPPFEVVGVKPGFNTYQEKGESAFEILTERSFPGKWKILFFYPKDFTFVCPTELTGFARYAAEFSKRGAVVMGGSTDNEHCKLAWRRESEALNRLPIWQFADAKGSLVDGLGVRSMDGVALRCTFIIDTENVIQHIYATNMKVGRNPEDTLRVLDAIQTGQLCACSRPIGGALANVAAEAIDQIQQELSPGSRRSSATKAELQTAQ
jgi:alkyl hydroperoxide reductase subunit AhpC